MVGGVVDVVEVIVSGDFLLFIIVIAMIISKGIMIIKCM